MQCPDCRLEIPSDSLFCCYCGQRLRSCAQCELFFTEEASFCGSCGADLVGPRTPTFSPPDDAEDSAVGFLYQCVDPDTCYALTPGDNTVGAGGNNDIVIHHPAISWNHAVFLCRDDRVLLQDSASTNGTFVNDQRVRTPHRLEHLDAIRFGSEEFQIWIIDAADGPGF